MEIDGEEINNSGGANTEEAYESTLDKEFQMFADRLAQNPEQVLRYEYSGQPLLYSKKDAVGKLFGGGGSHHAGGQGNVRVSSGASRSMVSRCGNCGAERVFEVQLTPHAIIELEAEEQGLEGMEWGTIIMEVCSKDCVPRGTGENEVGYVEEWIGVQWEELAK